MTRKLLNRFGLLTIALSMVMVACDSLSEPTSPLSTPGAAAHTDGLLPITKKFVVAKGLLDVKVKEDARVIQPAAGGDVGVAGNVLIIPAGAVLEPTLFVMRFKTTDGGTAKAEFELDAYTRDSKGDWTVNVGARGFLRPLRLKLRYDWITDQVAPEKLEIAWLKADGTHQTYLSLLDKNSQTVSTHLTHFSVYALGWGAE